MIQTATFLISLLLSAQLFAEQFISVKGELTNYIESALIDDL